MRTGSRPGGHSVLPGWYFSPRRFRLPLPGNRHVIGRGLREVQVVKSMDGRDSGEIEAVGPGDVIRNCLAAAAAERTPSGIVRLVVLSRR